MSTMNQDLDEEGIQMAGADQSNKTLQKKSMLIESPSKRVSTMKFQSGGCDLEENTFHNKITEPD